MKYGAIFTDELVHNICSLYEQGYDNMNIIQYLGLTRTPQLTPSLVRIRTGKQWKHISSQYSFEKRSYLRKHSNSDIHQLCKIMEYNSSPKSIQQELLSKGIVIEYDDLKKLVWFIRNKKSYVDISSQYNI